MNTLIRRCALASLLTFVGGVQPLAAQDSLAAARDLYASAQYEEALRILDGIAVAETPRDAQTVDLYRTLCFLAVGRPEDADRTIEAIIARDPLFEPGDELEECVRPQGIRARSVDVQAGARGTPRTWAGGTDGATAAR
jgi:hypothetical protein